jgi:hypothetical protein
VCNERGFCPRPVEAILGWAGTGHAARLALASAYLLGAVTKLSDFPAAIAEQAHFGMPFPALFAAATIAVELIGPALILSGRLVWLGRGCWGLHPAGRDHRQCLLDDADGPGTLWRHQRFLRTSRAGRRLRARRHSGGA